MDLQAAQTTRPRTSPRPPSTAMRQARPATQTRLTTPTQLAVAPRVDTAERLVETRRVSPEPSLLAAPQTTMRAQARATLLSVRNFCAQTYATQKQVVGCAAVLLGAAVGVICVFNPSAIAAYLMLSAAGQMGIALAAAVMSYCAVQVYVALRDVLPTPKQTAGILGGGFVGALAMTNVAPMLGPVGTILGVAAGAYAGYMLASNIDDPKAFGVLVMLALTALLLQQQAARQA